MEFYRRDPALCYVDIFCNFDINSICSRMDSKMSYLHLSSCLFATIVIHSYYRQVTSYHHMFLVLTMSSILFHTTHGETIRRIDKMLAHITYIMVVMDTPKAIATKTQWLLIFPFMVICMWFGQSLVPTQRDRMHVGLHLAAVVGMHVYLAVLYQNGSVESIWSVKKT